MKSKLSNQTMWIITGVTIILVGLMMITGFVDVISVSCSITVPGLGEIGKTTGNASMSALMPSNMNWLFYLFMVFGSFSILTAAVFPLHKDAKLDLVNRILLIVFVVLTVVSFILCLILAAKNGNQCGI